MPLGTCTLVHCSEDSLLTTAPREWGEGEGERDGGRERGRGMGGGRGDRGGREGGGIEEEGKERWGGRGHDERKPIYWSYNSYV